MTQQQGCRFVPYTFSANNWPQMVPLNLKIGETPGFFGGLDFLGPKSTTQKISWCIKCGGGCVVDFCFSGCSPFIPRVGYPSQHHLPPADSNLWCATSTGKSWSPVPWSWPVGAPRAGWVGLFQLFFWGGMGGPLVNMMGIPSKWHERGKTSHWGPWFHSNDFLGMFTPNYWGKMKPIWRWYLSDGLETPPITLPFP